jgi:hypothetical protein
MPLGSETFSTVPTKSYARAENTNKGKDKSKISAMRVAIRDFAVLEFIVDNIFSLIIKLILCSREEVYQSALAVTSGLNLALALAGLTRPPGWLGFENAFSGLKRPS